MYEEVAKIDLLLERAGREGSFRSSQLLPLESNRQGATRVDARTTKLPTDDPEDPNQN